MEKVLIVAALLLFCVAACGGSSSSDDGSEILVFAAASLGDATDEIARAFEAESGIRVIGNYAGSNALAQQIRATSRGDVFLSANETWMDEVAEADRIVAGTRRAFVSNQLVVIVRRGSEWSLDAPEQLVTLPMRYLSIGNPESVPAGIYARAWLRSIAFDGGTLWDALRSLVAPGANVRAALGLVEADERIVGIVYKTDAIASDRVDIAFEVPLDEAPAIRYSAACLRGAAAPEQAKRFLDFLGTDEAAAIFRRHGFVPLPR